MRNILNFGSNQIQSIHFESGLKRTPIDTTLYKIVTFVKTLVLFVFKIQIKNFTIHNAQRTKN